MKDPLTGEKLTNKNSVKIQIDFENEKDEQILNELCSVLVKSNKFNNITDIEEAKLYVVEVVSIHELWKIDPNKCTYDHSVIKKVNKDYDYFTAFIKAAKEKHDHSDKLVQNIIDALLDEKAELEKENDKLKKNLFKTRQEKDIAIQEKEDLIKQLHIILANANTLN